jgi:hypothetical protein
MRTPPLVLVLAGCLCLAGCAAAPTTGNYSELPDRDRLQPNARFPRSQVYVAEGVTFGQYAQFIIDPVAVYQGADASWNGVSEEAKHEMAQFVRSEFARALQPGYPVVEQPGPGVLRLKFTLVDLELTRPMLATASHLMPVGLAMNLGKGAAGAKGSFMGSVTLAGELIDARTGEVVASFLTVQSPNAMDVGAMTSQTGAARTAITEAAEGFKVTMDRAHAARPAGH